VGNWEAYTRNSPVASRQEVQTPLIILHNDQDGAVDFTQGMEYFNTLRRLSKPVVLLEYPGEKPRSGATAKPAGLHRAHEGVLRSLPEGRAAPDWLEYGVPRLKMQEHIDQRLKETRRSRKKNAPVRRRVSRGGGGRLWLAASS
jgi:hypothetical protein